MEKESNVNIDVYYAGILTDSESQKEERDPSDMPPTMKVRIESDYKVKIMFDQKMEYPNELYPLGIYY